MSRTRWPASLDARASTALSIRIGSVRGPTGLA